MRTKFPALLIVLLGMLPLKNEAQIAPFHYISCAGDNSGALEVNPDFGLPHLFVE
ncbi:MAG TPA: hypothetical protein PKI61_03235 [bacterium]|nr:hypothetical protein [bacterium]HPT30061.1 hypothetical protein [bacterium]